MAEATVITTLPGMAIGAIQCFERVQFGKNLSSDYDQYTIELRASQLQFTRWWKAAEPQLQTYPEEDQDVAKTLMKSIQLRFDEAEAASNRFAKRALRDQGAEAMEELGLAQEPEETSSNRSLKIVIRRLCKKVQEYCDRKMGQASWAIYERSRLIELVNNVSKLVKELNDMFPPEVEEQIDARQQELSQEEVRGLEKEALVALEKIEGVQDPYIQAAVKAAISGQNYYTFLHNTIKGDRSEATIGHTGPASGSGQTLWERNSITGDSSKAQIGNRYS
jgi:hypothetical protein